MKKLLLSIFLFSCSQGIAQDISNYPEKPYTTFRAFDIREDHIIAVGSCEQIWHSYNGGETWTIRDVGFNGSNVRMLNNGSNDLAIVTAFREVSLYSFEDGVLQSFITDLNDLNISDARNVEVIGQHVYLMANEGIVKGEVGTYNWEYVYQDTSESDFVSSTTATENYLFIGTREGRLIRHNTQNNTTELLQQFPDRIGSLNMANESIGYMTVSGALSVYKTTDGWNSYTEVPGLPETISPLGFGEDIVITVNTNRIYKSTDGGVTSTFIDTDLSPYFGLVQDAKFTEDGVLYLAGKGAMFAKSLDYGETWEFLNPTIRADFYASSISQNGVGYAVGEKNIIVKTEDHGNSWSLVETSISGEDHDYYNLAQLSDSKILVTGNNYYNIIEDGEISSTVYISLDGIIYNEAKDYLLATTYNNGVYKVLKSIDQGENWVEVFENDDISFAINQNKSGKIFIPTSDGNVAISSDDGETWSVNKFWEESIRRVVFYDDDYGLILSGRSLMKTTDGGETFEEVANGYGIAGVTILSPEHFIYSTGTNDATNLRESIDGGETWKTIFSNCTTTVHASVNSFNQLILSQRTGHINLVNTSISTGNVDIGENEIEVSISPNPVLGGDMINIVGDYDYAILYTLDGHILSRTEINNKMLRTTNLHSGIYLVSVFKGHNRTIQRVVVVR